MTPYAILLVLAIVIAYLGRIPRSSAIRHFSIGTVSGMLILFAGLRDSRVGSDTGSYVHAFRLSESYTAATEFDLEIGFLILGWLSRSISESYAALLLAVASISVACYMRTITKLVPRYETAIFLFITLGVYTFSFNTARQGIAAAICFFAVPYLLERRWRPYVALVAVATLFHQTALIALPLYLVAGRTLGGKQLIMIAAGSMITVASLRNIVDLASSMVDGKFATYGEAGEGGGAVFAVFLIAQGAVLYLLKGRFRGTDDTYARLLNLYLVGLVPVVASVLASVNASGVLRLHMYFTPMAMLLWPKVFKTFDDAPTRGLFAIGFCAVMLSFFTLTTTTFGGLTPYLSSTEIFK